MKPDPCLLDGMGVPDLEEIHGTRHIPGMSG
jgi:hypothetical protein